jgi:hypothetical protein
VSFPDVPSFESKVVTRPFRGPARGSSQIWTALGKRRGVLGKHFENTLASG